ncbi:MAG: zinc-dependent alcohol dehydrogenase [Sedimentisphaerales bacterium]
MKALMKIGLGNGNIELKEIPLPIPVKDEVLIKVNTAGVCGTDVHIWHDRFPNTPPVVLGHEFSGTIERIGPEVEGLKEGDKVVSANNPFACGKCGICNSGNPNLCPEKKAMGIHSDGCFADYVKLPSQLIYIIPENVSFEQAALMEPLAVAIHAVTGRCRVYKDDTVVVFGVGAIGLLAAQVAHAEGAANILLVGTTKDEKTRFKCANELGFKTLNIEKENLTSKVMEYTCGHGVDVVVEASGSSAAVTQGLNLLKRTGRMAISGITGKPNIPIGWDGLISKEATLYFSYGSVNADWEMGLKYLAERKVLTLPLITHHFKLSQWQDAFSVLESMDAIRPIFKIG